MIYDVIIIGLGPGGFAASIYASRGGLKTLVFESKIPGGLLNYTNVVNNYPGFINITGPELASKMYEHFKTFDIDYRNEDVIDLIDGDVKTIITSTGEYKAKNVIIATGRSRRSLNLDGEKELMGHGISYCAMCDGHFFKGKDVTVVGGGDSALEEALYLANIVNSVTILIRGKKLAGNMSLVDSVENNKKINIIYEKNITKLNSTEGMLESVVLNDNSILKTDGLFIYIGFDPILPFKSEINIKKEKGYILVDKDFQTNLEGIYAIGDIIKKDLYQIISAEYEGASASSAILRKLTNKN